MFNGIEIENSGRIMDIIWKNLELTLSKAVEHAQHWEEVCNCIVTILGANGVILVPTNPNFRGQWMSCSTGLKATLPEYLAGGWHLRDPREKVTSLMLENGIATDTDLFPDRHVKYDMPFYKDFLCKHDFGMLTALKILTPNGHWGMMVHFANDHPGINEEQISKLKRLRPLLENAAKEAYQAAHMNIASFAQFFNGTDSEVFILDTHGSQTLRLDNFGKLIHTNGVEKLLPADVSHSLKDELAELCSSAPHLSLSKAYHFRENGDSVTVLVIQVPSNLRHYFMPFKVCAIRTRCSENTATKHQKLRDEFNLTEAEISTVELLSSGKTPQIISDVLGLKTSSIRQRLKGIYEKTFVSGQIELVAFYRNI